MSFERKSLLVHFSSSPHLKWGLETISRGEEASVETEWTEIVVGHPAGVPELLGVRTAAPLVAPAGKRGAW